MPGISAEAVVLLVQSFLLPQVSERPDVGQGKGEAEQIFVADVGNSVASVFHRHAAAIPVVGGLCGGELQLPGVCVNAEIGRGAQSSAVEPAIAERDAKLLKL